MSSSLITPVIICGGSGTRLWPLSRESQPKQFIPIGGGTSTFQQVLARVADPGNFASPIVVTNTEFRFTVADQLQRSSVSGDILLEPVGRDSGPAIAVATEFAGRRNREAILLVLAADHIVHDTDAFRRSC
jgi:mannose-1-phosphate guanylyltransferase/mannose-6-phosphate isomerase